MKKLTETVDKYIIYHKLVYLFLMISFTINLFRFMAIPFLTLFLTSKFDVSASQVGLLVGTPALIQLGLSVFLSGITEKMKLKWATISSLLLPTVGMIGYISLDQFYLIFLSSVISGVGWSVYNPLIMSALAKYSDENQVDHVFGLHYWVFNLGGVLGPLIGVYIGAGQSIAPFYFFIIALMLMALIVFFMIPAKEQVSRNDTVTKKGTFLKELKQVITDKRAIYLFLAYFSIFFIEVQFETNFPIYLRNHFGETGTKIVGWTLSAMTVTVLITQPISLRMLKKITPVRLFLSSSVIYVIGLFVFTFSGWTFMFLSAAILISLGEVIGVPKMQALNAKIAPVHLKTTYFAFVTMGGNLAFFLGPILGGLLLPFKNGLLLFALLIILGAVSGVFASISQTNHDRGLNRKQNKAGVLSN